ncbi:MAG: AMP-binding protein [Actinomycetota bacterium]
MKVELTVNDFLRRAETVYADRIGLVDEPDVVGGGLGSLTWAEVGRLARAQAAALDQRGIGVGERVGIVSMNAARFVVSFFGVSGWGRVLVPINFRLSTVEMEYIVKHSGCSLLLVDPDMVDTVASIDIPKIVLGAEGDEELYLHGADPRPWDGLEADTATINYTSGTTARPKGVQLTHRNIWLNATTFALHTSVTDRDVYLHTLPMFHCNGWGMPYGVAGMGGTQIVIRKVDGADILRRIDQHGVTLMCGAPAVVAMILDAAGSWQGEIPGRDRVRMVVAGAPPPTSTIEAVEKTLGWEFIQIYGLTETAPLLTINRRRREFDDMSVHDRAVALGRAGAPALGIQMKISDQGEVLARGNHILEGYWDQPEASADALEGGWFHTGDGGTIDEDHYLTISDRKKDVIISGGENVSSIEVEDALFSHEAVAEAAVIGVPDEKWGETVKGLVVLHPGTEATERELIDHCRDRLAHYKCPTSVEIRDELSRTATGKLQKFKLRAPYWEGREKLVN